MGNLDGATLVLVEEPGDCGANGRKTSAKTVRVTVARHLEFFLLLVELFCLKCFLISLLVYGLRYTFEIG